MSRRRVLVWAIAGFLVLFALLLSGANRTSLTADELTYITLGYSLLARGRAAFPLLTSRGYPPLLIALEGLPLYAANPHIPMERLYGWPTDYSLVVQAFRPYFLPLSQMKLLARLPIIFLTLILGAVVFRWGKDFGGHGAGLLALGVLIFDPLLLGTGRLANSDAGTVALGTAALFVTWRWTQKPGWRWVPATGILLALTLLAKASGLLWAAAAGLMIITAIVTRGPERRSLLLLQGAAAAGLSLLLLWAGYGFEWGRVPGFPWPVPAPTHWENVLYLTRYVDNYFALGFRQHAGWWWYFPVAFLIKNPLPLLIGLLFASVALCRRPWSWVNVLTLGYFPVLYTGVAVAQGLDLGYRFILPVHPFIYLALGTGLGPWAWDRRTAPIWRWSMLALGVWYVARTVSVSPYEIAYFNELVGGPDAGYQYLSDSNVDWGQSLNTQQAYIQEHPDVVSQPPASRFQPTPGRYIVGASALQGIGISDPDAYEWFRHRDPQAVIDHSLLVYDVAPANLSWVAQCDVPGPPLDAASIVGGTGRADLRQVSFDCTRAWLYPGGETGLGLFALDQSLFGPERLCFPTFLACPPAASDSFVARHLATAQLSYEQTTNGRLPAFALYATVSTTVQLPPPATAFAVPVGATRPDVAGSTPLPVPVRFNGPLMLLGVKSYLTPQTLEVETWWRVTESAVSRPYSIIAHLTTSAGDSLGVADGLGVSPATLMAGDVFVQRHIFPMPDARTPLYLLTGAYWLDTPQRWQLADVTRADLLFIKLNPN